jgi:hypothetical protein
MTVTTWQGGREDMAQQQQPEAVQHTPLDPENTHELASLIVDIHKMNGTEPPEWAKRIAANPPAYPAAS